MNVIDMAEEAFTALDELRHSSAENVEASETASVEDDYKAWDWAVERGLVPEGKLRDDKFREEIAAASKYELVRRIIREWAASQGASNGTAWQAVDLQALVDGGTNGIPASVLLRTDGRALLVPSALNTVFGYGGQGKSFFATMAIAQVILGGRDAAYLSYELAPEVIVDRLHNVFQVPMDLILRHLRIYYRQIGYPGGVIEGSESGIAVAVIDSTNRALVAHGFRENDVSGFSQLVLDVITPFVDSGTAVLTIDHVTQAKETRDRPINSVSKFNDVQGAMYSLETGIPFAKDKSGWAKLVLRKDNTSATDWARDDVVGYLVCEANARGEGLSTISIEPDAPNTADISELSQMNTKNARVEKSDLKATAIVVAVQDKPGQYDTTNLAEKLTEKHQGTPAVSTWKRAIKQAIDNGLIVKDKPGKLWPQDEQL